VELPNQHGRVDRLGARLLSLGRLAAGADGVHIEVHHCPEKAKSDGPQALLPSQYRELANQLRELATLLGKRISTTTGAAA